MENWSEVIRSYFNDVSKHTYFMKTSRSYVSGSSTTESLE